MQPSVEPAQPPITVAPTLPLALLEAVRSHDRPREVLEDEDLAASLPRRLGLTDVIESQIRQYEEAVRRNRSVPQEQFGDLVRLVLRRPDAETVFRDAGHRVAHRYFQSMPGPALLALRLLPARVGFLAVNRGARRMLRRAVGAGALEISGRPPVTRITGTPTARFDGSGKACVFYTGALEELIYLYTGQRPLIVHSNCESRGDATCEWQLVGS